MTDKEKAKSSDADFSAEQKVEEYFGKKGTQNNTNLTVNPKIDRPIGRTGYPIYIPFGKIGPVKKVE